MYTITDESVEVLDEDSSGLSGGIVDLNSNNCTCIANSHGVECVCIHVARLANAFVATSVETDTDSGLVLKNENVPNVKDCKTMIGDLYIWSQSSSYKENPSLRDALKKVHKMALSSFTKKHAKKRKITVLHPHRRRIRAKLLQNEVCTKSPVLETKSSVALRDTGRTTKFVSFKPKSGCIQSRTKYHKRMKLPKSTKKDTQL